MSIESQGRENYFEKEKDIQKIILFIRHPCPQWIEALMEHASKHGEDVETYLPLNSEGLKMVRHLVSYMKPELTEKISDNDYKLFSSSAKRAHSAADIILKNLRLAKTHDPRMPKPVNEPTEILKSFNEIMISDDREYILDLISRANEKSIHPLRLWLEENGKEIMPKFQKKFEEMKEGLKHLENESTKLNIVISHMLAISVAVFIANNPEKVKDDKYELTLEDLDEIFSYGSKLPFTSITQFNVLGDSQMEVKNIGETPHLEGNEETKRLVRGAL